MFASAEPPTFAELDLHTKVSVVEYLKVIRIRIRCIDKIHRDKFYRQLIDTWGDLQEKLAKAKPSDKEEESKQEVEDTVEEIKQEVEESKVGVDHFDILVDMGNGVIMFSVRPTDNISTLKVMIQNKTATPTFAFNLYYEGKFLEDSNDLSSIPENAQMTVRYNAIAQEEVEESKGDSSQGSVDSFEIDERRRMMFLYEMEPRDHLRLGRAGGQGRLPELHEEAGGRDRLQEEEAGGGGKQEGGGGAEIADDPQG